MCVIRKCTKCGRRVDLPSKVNGDDSRQVRCPNCGAKAPLMVRRRNGRVRGLKGCFLEERRKTR